jgi:peptidoglycan/xylan/chitin deacetylase (PgdA/CDA1 family)
LLYPYRVEIGKGVDEPDVIICRGTSDSSRPQIRVPQTDHGSDLDAKNCGDEVVELPFDLISRCSERFEAAMNPKIGFAYKLATRMPFQYNNVPSSIRSWFLRKEADSNLSDHLANEVARKTVVEAFDLLGFHLKRKDPPSLVITHDIDTEKGLRRALVFKTVEDELNIKSTWFLPSDEYPIPRTLARNLVHGSTIGSHDTKHDGRLIHIHHDDELVQRLKNSRAKLEELFETEVRCFRAPLLQFNRRIVMALAKAGYRFDFSAPCWEPVHPSTMGGFGVETVQGFETDGLVEVPLTLFQDHQVLNIMGMSIDEAIKLWLKQARLIRSFEGDIVLLTHPDYSFSRDLDAYRRLLRSLMEVHEESDHSLVVPRSVSVH